MEQTVTVNRQYAYYEPQQPPKSAGYSGLPLPSSTSIRAGEPFTTEFEPERMPEAFRPIEGNRSVPNPSLDRSVS
jgi:hypothetical protein